MEYLVSLSDSTKRHLVVLTLDKTTVERSAIDVVFETIGTKSINALIEANVLAAGMSDDLLALQNEIFGEDAQGSFIKDTVYFTANGKDLNPDAPLVEAFVLTSSDRGDYYRLDLVVHDSSSSKGSQQDSFKDLARIFLLHQIAFGVPLDVTKEYPEVAELLSQAEKDNLIDIDVSKAAYKLTDAGKRVHDSYIQEAQDLIRRFDIYVDVDIDQEGVARFDTGLGKDLRVPVWELEGIDPFRARFLLGLNDGEWDDLMDWHEVAMDERWYSRIFAPIESAPSVEDIGSETLLQVIDQGKKVLRMDPFTRS